MSFLTDKGKMEKERYYVIDFIRAFVILNMIIYHALWDIVYLFDRDIEWYVSDMGEIWQRFICITFIVLSGFCWSMSRNHVKRGIYTLVMGAVISVITMIFVPEGTIKYGILTMIGSAVLIMIPLEKVLKYANDWGGFILSILLYVFTKDINRGYLLFYSVKVPEYLYRGEFMTYLGFEEEGFYSADYFSLIPWIFVFISGYFLYRIMKRKNLIMTLKGVPNHIIEGISRGSLVIYMLHQPVVYGLILGVYELSEIF